MEEILVGILLSGRGELGVAGPDYRLQQSGANTVLMARFQIFRVYRVLSWVSSVSDQICKL